MNNIVPILILVIISTVMGSVASLFLKLGAKHIRLKELFKILQNWKLILGIVLYILSAVVFIASLRLGELSIVYPLTSISYIFVTILSALVLKERINVYKICGIGFIILGVVLVTL